MFLRDRVTRDLTRVSVSTYGIEGNQLQRHPSISADGRHITFYSCATNFDPLDTNGLCDFFVRDRDSAHHRAPESRTERRAATSSARLDTG